ncbi:MAG: hypothetical protein CMH27_03260 [Micavibrio sp.]|nr:hypothetical protein [Micavibrio sp.]|tara:strand:- start:6775 stop:7584 length:810 start_codon:yes stop_codon:yes gene_type:complete
MSVIWNNGCWVDADAEVFRIADRIRLGDGVFDTMLCVDGQPCHAEKHFIRLAEGAAVLGIDWGVTFSEFMNLAAHLIQKNAEATKGRFALNTVLSRGEGDRGLSVPQEPKPHAVMRLTPVPQVFPPVRGCFASTVYRNEGSPLSRIKSCNYGDNILALREASAKGFDDAVLLNNAGHVTCTTMGNIFALRSGRLYTPPLRDGVLNGVARQIMCARYDVLEQSMTKENLLDADEVFLTNSIRGAVFFKALEGKTLGENSLGIDKDFHVSS